MGKESPYIFSKFNPLNSDTFCGLLSVRIRLIVLIGYRAGKKGISLLTTYGFQKVSFWPYNIFLLTELVRSRWLGFSWPLSFLSVIIDFDFVSAHKNAKQKNLANIHLAWSSITHLRANSEGEGGGTKTSFRSPPTPNPRACSQASESGRFIPVAFFDFYCTKQIYIVCLHVTVLS